MLYFASAASFTRKSSEEFSAPLSIADLFERLEQSYPGIKDNVLASSLLTINLQYVDLVEDGSDNASTTMINEGDEVAIIPPVSAG